MIVLNKRYYDYDADHNTIIMFDPDDTFEMNAPAPYKSASSSSSSTPLTPTKRLESESTETVEDLVKPDTAETNENEENVDVDDASQKSEHLEIDPEEEEPAERAVCWISNGSPKGPRIPFSIGQAHSYAMKCLNVSLATLVDTVTLKKQQEEEALRREAMKRAHRKAVRDMYLQQQQAQYARMYPLPPQGQAHPYYTQQRVAQPMYAHGPPPQARYPRGYAYGQVRREQRPDSRLSQ